MCSDCTYIAVYLPGQCVAYCTWQYTHIYLPLHTARVTELQTMHKYKKRSFTQLVTEFLSWILFYSLILFFTASHKGAGLAWHRHGTEKENTRKAKVGQIIILQKGLWQKKNELNCYMCHTTIIFWGCVYINNSPSWWQLLFFGKICICLNECQRACIYCFGGK